MHRIMQRVAIIVCDNGLGHMRRSCLVASRLIANGCRVTILGSPVAWQKIKKVMIIEASIEFISLETCSSAANFERPLEQILSWLNHVPELEDFDEIISDNLVEALLLRDDVKLYAQFFWHECLPSINRDYQELCRKLLEKVRPIIYGYCNFAMPEIVIQPGFQPTEVLMIPEHVNAAKTTKACDRKDLLITGGTTSIMRPIISAIVDNIQKNRPAAFRYIYVDPESLPDAECSWIRPADFTISMYQNLKGAICRPGLGVISDLMAHGILPSCIYEPGNREMQHNANIIKMLRGQ